MNACARVEKKKHEAEDAENKKNQEIERVIKDILLKAIEFSKMTNQASLQKSAHDAKSLATFLGSGPKETQEDLKFEEIRETEEGQETMFDCDFENADLASILLKIVETRQRLFGHTAVPETEEVQVEQTQPVEEEEQEERHLT